MPAVMESKSHAHQWKLAARRDLTMNPRFRPPKWALILILVGAVSAPIVAFSSVREPVLRAAGWALVVSEPVAPANIIVVSLSSGGAGALEAADLIQTGIATRVAVFTDPPSGDDYEFIRRGLPYEDMGAERIRQLRWLGVTMWSKSREPTLERKVKPGCFRRGAISIGSAPLCSWPLDLIRNECGACSAES
jgi:hypothetical protein